MYSSAISVMQELGLLSWRSLLVGWLRGWAKRQDVVDYSVSQLLNGESDPTLEIAQLAAAESYSDEAITSRLMGLAAWQGQPVDRAVADSLSGWQSYSDVDVTVRQDLDKWRLATLVTLTRSESNRQELLDRLEATWTEFGYPEDMEQVSRYYFTPEERASGSQVTQGIADRPFIRMLEMIDNLSSELVGQKSNDTDQN